ncbi:hypothetical protein [Streptomyces sp. NPDC056160]|uniref:hypothetical protein n=1 Tax=Streptomyces sp. NPDC056160 TaxID=3345731 RepID=UPI0035DA0E70
MGTDTTGTTPQDAIATDDGSPCGTGGPGGRTPSHPRVRGRHRRPRPRPRKALLTAGGLALAAGVLSLVRLAPEYGHGGPGAAEAEPYRHGGPDGGAAGASHGAALTGAGTAPGTATAGTGGNGPSALPSSPLPMGGAGSVAAPGTEPALPGRSPYGTGLLPPAGPPGPESVPTTAPAPRPGTPDQPGDHAGTPRTPTTTRPPHAPSHAPAPGTHTPAPQAPPTTSPPSSGGGGKGRGSGGDGDVCVPVIGLCVGAQ